MERRNSIATRPSGSGPVRDLRQTHRCLSACRTAAGDAMYVGTQIEPRNNSDYRVWTQLGVTHVCVDPPGSPHYWSLDALHRHKDHVESFGLSLDMVQLPISSGPIEAGDRPHILLARDPEWQREIDGLCGLIERLAAVRIP